MLPYVIDNTILFRLNLRKNSTDFLKPKGKYTRLVRHTVVDSKINPDNDLAVKAANHCYHGLIIEASLPTMFVPFSSLPQPQLQLYRLHIALGLRLTKNASCCCP